MRQSTLWPSLEVLLQMVTFSIQQTYHKLTHCTRRGTKGAPRTSQRNEDLLIILICFSFSALRFPGQIPLQTPSIILSFTCLMLARTTLREALNAFNNMQQGNAILKI